jgi:hypothetical protein
VDSLPHLLFALSSINDAIVKSGFECLICFFTIADISVWWPRVEAVLLDRHLRSAQISLLDLITPHQEQIPLEPIALLLEDPHPRIEKKASQISESNPS